MSIPVEEGAIDEFTPSSLANIPVPPVFLLKPGTRRDRKQFKRTCAEEHLVWHDSTSMRAEMLRGLERMWDAETFAREAARLRAYWDAVDYFIQRIGKGEADAELEVSKDEAKAVDALIGRITNAWKPLRKLGIDNAIFQEESPRVAMAVTIVGWRCVDIDVPFVRDGGVVPLETIDDLFDALVVLEYKYGNVSGVGEPETAFRELSTAAQDMLFLTRQEEKNSASPPPSSPTPQGSKTAGRARTSGRSKASASSKKIRSAS